MAKFTREEVEETAHNLEQEDLAGVDLSGHAHIMVTWITGS